MAAPPPIMDAAFAKSMLEGARQDPSPATLTVRGNLAPPTSVESGASEMEVVGDEGKDDGEAVEREGGGSRKGRARAGERSTDMSDNDTFSMDVNGEDSEGGEGGGWGHMDDEEDVVVEAVPVPASSSAASSSAAADAADAAVATWSDEVQTMLHELTDADLVEAAEQAQQENSDAEAALQRSSLYVGESIPVSHISQHRKYSDSPLSLHRRQMYIPKKRYLLKKSLILIAQW